MKNNFLILFILYIVYNKVYCKTSEEKKFTYNTKHILESSNLLLIFNDTNDLYRHAEFSNVKADDTDTFKYNGKWRIIKTNSTPFVNDYQLVMSSNKSFAAVSFGMLKPFRFTEDKLVVQYDFRYPNGHDCGGAYIKLMPEKGFQMKKLSNDSLYSIMFGPDKCSMDYQVKFNYMYWNKDTNKYVEHSLRNSKSNQLPRFLGDNITHVITLILHKNNSFEIFKNLRPIYTGNLIDDFEPCVAGVKMIEDPDDVQPSDWEQPIEIPDPAAIKPDDWDENEPEYISDPDAKKPKKWLDSEPLYVLSDETKPYDWDEEVKGPWKRPKIKNIKCKTHGCGKWTPPIIRNPKYRGKWSPPLITNPNYRGEWKPRMIQNPKYRGDEKVYENLLSFNSLSIDIWAETGGVQYDNILVTSNFTLAKELAQVTWWPKFEVDTVHDPVYRNLVNSSSEIKPVKRGIRQYIHWLWAAIPVLFGLPILIYVIVLISRKSNRNFDVAKEKYLLEAYNRLKSAGDENSASILADGGSMKNFQDIIQGTYYQNHSISEEAINQMFGGADDRVASVIRQRIKQSAHIAKNQSPMGDAL